MPTRAAIQAIASYLPSTKLSNDQLAEQLGTWTAAEIFEKTGVKCRGIAGADECASDLGTAAAERLFASGACRPEEVDFLLFCTQSPDYALPSTACLVQRRLGLRTDCGAVDFNQGCSGFVYGLALAKGLVEAGTARKVLLITAETYSKYIHPRDRSVRTIFGDGAAATLIAGVDDARELIGPIVLGTDGTGSKNLIVPVSGARRRPTPETAVASERESGNWRSDENLYMNGPEIFTFTLRTVPVAVRTLLERWQHSLAEVDLFVFHQASRFMLERLRDKMALPVDKFWIDLEESGNTVSATIPIAIEQAVARGRVAGGSRLMLVGFGVGYSWAAAMVSLP